MAKGPDAGAEFVVDFPTLWVVPDWIEAHCPIPDGFRAGEDLELYPWQLWCTVNHYRVKPTATVGQLAPAFHYRRSQVVAPQKTGKGPWSATIVLAEAAGPVVFNGWAKGGERYRCSDHGCGCGWWYEYQPGEPMGVPWPTPLIQLTATSEDQVDNVYRPLRSMVKRGPLAEIMQTGEEFTRVGDDGRVDVVTSSALSRLGNPIIFAMQDETGLYTTANKLRKVAETQRRGAAGMGGRSMETTNAWDPSEDSVAQTTSQAKARDIFKYHPQAPKSLSFKSKRQRRQIFRHVYAGSAHVDLDAIEAECAEIMEKDPAQGERFFGNRCVAGSAAWLDGAKWAAKAKPRRVRPGTRIVLGFDGSDVDDWTALRAETMDGYQFTPKYGPNDEPTIWNPADYGGQVPRAEVRAAVDQVFRRYDVVRMYADPPYWETEIDGFVDLYGQERVIRWHTRRIVQMHSACERLKTDVLKRNSPGVSFTHDGCEITQSHIENTRAAARPMDRYVLRKASPVQKIDATVPSVLVHEALGDVIAAGLAEPEESYYYGK
uniref:Terminase n=1 Tax=Streptomyces sp. NBC_00093 TaxID=2975649 RepID=A0AAU2A1J4_9ACTN